MNDCYYEYMEVDGTPLFTVVLKPEKEGCFPIVLVRNPYVDVCENMDEAAIVEDYHSQFSAYLESGFAVVYQHCRGRGKSGGDCVPYIHEREDGLAMLDWVRHTSFYRGELYLKGNSYLTSVWYAVAPYGKDIKGAIFAVQITDRYTICYTNGFLKKALHCDWYVKMYKAKSHIKKNYGKDTLNTLPLTGITKEIFGEYADDFENMMQHPDPNDPFWLTRYGGGDARNATQSVDFPMLFTTAWFDIYTGGVFDLWNALPPESRARSALAVSAYNHGDKPDQSPIVFPNGGRNERFPGWELEWFRYLSRGGESPFQLGHITYFSLFDNQWRTEQALSAEKSLSLTLGEDIVTYTYNPYCPSAFPGGLSRNFGGTAYQKAPGSRYDVVTVYTKSFDRDTLVKGKMGAELWASTDCDDTCFMVRISLEKPEGDYGLRDDITSVCLQHSAYQRNGWVSLTFAMDEISFTVHQGERLRVDIASADNDHYVRHTNQKGLYCQQTTAKIAHNSVDLSRSRLILPVVTENDDGTETGIFEHL